MHVITWHVDEREKAGIPSSHGVAVAANWASAPDSTLSDQTTIEAFWRFQFSQGFAITPSLQLLIDPALNPVDDEVWVLGLRMRLAF